METEVTEVNYYVFDEITKDSGNQYWGHLNGKTVEVYPLDEDETDEEIKAVGFAKCDAPKGYTETFVVEETAWAIVYATNAPSWFLND